MSFEQVSWPKATVVNARMATRIRNFNWDATPVGPLRSWSAPMRAAVQGILTSPIPMVTIWGEQGILIYNEGYAQVCGPRDGKALGAGLLDIWPEARDFNAQVIANGLAGNSMSFSGQELELWRLGRAERVWMDLEYSPILDDNGEAIGVLAIVIDITDRVETTRRNMESEKLFRFLDRLAVETSTVPDADEMLNITTKLLAQHLGLTNCAYADMDRDADGFTIRGDWHAPGTMSIRGHYSLKSFGRLAVQELGAGRPLIINDNLVELDADEAATFQDIGISATICMPLVRGERLVALMAGHHAAPHKWTEDELRTIREATARSWAHIERINALEHLRKSEGRFRALVNASSDAIFRMSADCVEMRYLDGRGRLQDEIGQSIHWMDSQLVSEDVAGVRQAIDAAIEAKSHFELEHRVKKADGAIGWTMSRAVPVLDDAGEIIEWFGMATDVTERRRSEEHLRLIVNELNHRVKNSLAMVQAIANQTFRNTDNAAEALERYTARLIALARANDLLTGEAWTEVDLGSVLLQAVEPHRPHPDRLRLAGPNLKISAKSALALTLAVHELATNATKYGAWSNETGHVAISWFLEGSAENAHLVVDWAEAGGPRVVASSRRGFGSRLIERGLAAELNGISELRYEPEGLRWYLKAPLGPMAEELPVAS